MDKSLPSLVDHLFDLFSPLTLFIFKWFIKLMKPWKSSPKR